jgi:hypothetical protein
MKDAESVFSGMASSYTRADSFREEINATPIKLGTGFHHSQSRKKKVDPKSPDSFQFSDENDKPDFSEAVDSWTEEAVIYGITTFDVFRSRNNRLRYIFCRDSKERAWIAGIDIKDEGVTSQGIKKQWVEASDLCTPAFEYWKQTDGYENDDLTANQNQYVDMYANYIQYIPLVQEYQAWARAQVHITRSNKSGPNIVD